MLNFSEEDKDYIVTCILDYVSDMPAETVTVFGRVIFSKVYFKIYKLRFKIRFSDTDGNLAIIIRLKSNDITLGKRLFKSVYTDLDSDTPIYKNEKDVVEETAKQKKIRLKHKGK